MTKKYEYKEVDSDLIKAHVLEQCGNEGWQLCSFNPKYGKYYFKREKEVNSPTSNVPIVKFNDYGTFIRLMETLIGNADKCLRPGQAAYVIATRLFGNEMVTKAAADGADCFNDNRKTTTFLNALFNEQLNGN